MISSSDRRSRIIWIRLSFCLSFVVLCVCAKPHELNLHYFLFLLIFSTQFSFGQWLRRYRGTFTGWPNRKWARMRWYDDVRLSDTVEIGHARCQQLLTRIKLAAWTLWEQERTRDRESETKWERERASEMPQSRNNKPTISISSLVRASARVCVCFFLHTFELIWNHRHRINNKKIGSLLLDWNTQNARNNSTKSSKTDKTERNRRGRQAGTREWN